MEGMFSSIHSFDVCTLFGSSEVLISICVWCLDGTCPKFLLALEHISSEGKGEDQFLQSLLKHTTVTGTDLESGKSKELRFSGAKPIKTDELPDGLASLSELSMGEIRCF
jgi:hypothetical protein